MSTTRTTGAADGWIARPKPRFSREEGGAGQSAGQGAAPPAKRMKKARTKQQKMEVVAPQATLDGLPDSVLLLIMNCLGLFSLVQLAHVCRRFQHLSRDASLWEHVELTRDSISRRMNSQGLKRLIRLYLGPPLRSVVLEETSRVGNVVITEALVDLLFSSCPHIQSVTLLNCDLRKFSHSCSVFTSPSLENVSFVGCEFVMDWTSALSPTWPSLQTLRLDNSTKTNSRDLYYVATKKEWQATLRYISVKGCYRISMTLFPEVVEAISSSLPALRTLDIRDTKLAIKDSLASKLQQKNLKLLI